MKRSTILGIITTTALVPAVASAQSADPDDTQPPPAPAPAPTTTPPVVVVNPPATEQTNVPPPQAYTQPETTEVTEYWSAPVFATGAIVFAGSYGASAIVAASSSHPGAERLYVPLVGPWLALSDWGNCPVSQPSCDTNTTDKVLLVADGLFQAAGVITMLDGVLQPRTHHVVRTDRTVHVQPTHNGMVVFGHF